MGLFAKHLSKDILQFGLFVGRKSGDSSFQTTFVNRPLIGHCLLRVPYVQLLTILVGQPSWMLVLR